MRIRPLSKNVVVKQQEAEKIKGGLYIPDSVSEKPEIGIVVAVTEDSKLKVGEKVLYKKWAGNEVQIDATESLTVIDEQDLLGVIEEV